jgi:hypothetical protein
VPRLLSILFQRLPLLLLSGVAPSHNRRRQANESERDKYCQDAYKRDATDFHSLEMDALSGKSSVMAMPGPN